MSPVFEIKELTLPSCFEIKCRRQADSRGFLQKTFQQSKFAEFSEDINFVEQYFSYSTKNVIRGMHFQVPPMQHWKLVTAVKGNVTDVLLDLRKNSPTYGFFFATELSDEKSNSLLIAPGVAHGFCVQSEHALLLYNCSSEYSPQHDAGVRWDSFGYKWEISSPIVSDRDKQLPKFDNNYQSAFLL